MIMLKRQIFERIAQVASTWGVCFGISIDGSLYWLLGSSVREIVTLRTVYPSFTACIGVTRAPTDLWVAQQLREATPYGQAPKYLIYDNDRKFGSCFARVASTSAIEILRTPYHAPRANAICERFLRRSHRICQVPRPSYSEHTYGEKTVMPLTRKTFPLASGQCPEALPLKH